MRRMSSRFDCRSSSYDINVIPLPFQLRFESMLTRVMLFRHGSNDLDSSSSTERSSPVMLSPSLRSCALSAPTDDWMLLLICINCQYSTTNQTHIDLLTPLFPSSAARMRATSPGHRSEAIVMRHHSMRRAAQN